MEVQDRSVVGPVRQLDVFELDDGDVITVIKIDGGKNKLGTCYRRVVMLSFCGILD